MMNGFKSFMRCVTAFAATGGAAVGLVMAVGACSSSPRGGPGGSLTAADFASSTQETSAISGAPAPTAHTEFVEPVDPPQPANITGPIAASEGIVDVIASPGVPELPTGPRPDPVGGAVLVDAKIGDVNGRPIYASKFLESMGDRLRAIAVEFQKKSDQAKAAGMRVPDWKAAWRNEARRAIDSDLNSFIEDELLRAEAIAGFAPEQRQGFFAFMQGVSDKMESENMGSRSAANRALQSQGGLEAYLKAREQEELIKFQLYQKINKRVNITWRDIKLEYDKLVALNGSAPAITIRRVEMKADNPAVRTFKEDLAANVAPFAKLAENPANLNDPDEGGFEKIIVVGPPEKFRYYGHPELNTAAQSLQSGQTVGPIAVGAFLDWLHRDEDRAVPPLYDWQDRLEGKLRRERVAVEKAKYIEHLKAKSTMTSVKEMSDRLLQIAEDRYLPKKAS
jgi:hypothetical protein